MCESVYACLRLHAEMVHIHTNTHTTGKAVKYGGEDFTLSNCHCKSSFAWTASLWGFGGFFLAFLLSVAVWRANVYNAWKKNCSFFRCGGKEKEAGGDTHTHTHKHEGEGGEETRREEGLELSSKIDIAVASPPASATTIFKSGQAIK